MARSLMFTIDDLIDVLVEEDDFDGDGDTELRFTLTVDESEGYTADIRGLFWDVRDESMLGDLVASGDDVTDSRFEANKVEGLGNGANMIGAATRGKDGQRFDAGVEIGTEGASADDIQTTTFIVEGLTLDDISDQRFGVRLTSVGEIDGEREGSLKLTGVAAYAPSAPDAVDDDFTLDEDTLITGNVLANDTDGDGDTLTVTDFTIVDGAGIADDSLMVNADGSFSFEPVTSFTGDVTFTYEVSDGNGGTDSATATVTIEEVTGITKDLGEVPLDIVLAFDLSGSFRDDLNYIKGSDPGDFFPTLDSAIDPTGSGDVKFAVTSYIDYPFSSYGSYSDFIYNANQDLTATDADVMTAIDGLTIGSGGDGPEAQLVALQQVGLGNGLTYTEGSERFVVLSTDAYYHLAGDFGEGGLNDNDTDLADGLGPNGVEDYPTVEQVAEALASNGVTPIFAVTAWMIPQYQTLLDALNEVDPSIGGSVVELASDSSNLTDAITEGLFQDLDGTAGRDTLTGNSLRNTIDGGDRADIIDGQGGDDRLIGGNGNDILTGGDGTDTFVFENDTHFRGTDTVTDYQVGTDMLELSGFGAIGFGDLTITDVDGDAHIAAGDAEDAPIAILEGVAAADLSASDFILVA